LVYSYWVKLLADQTVAWYVSILCWIRLSLLQEHQQVLHLLHHLGHQQGLQLLHHPVRQQGLQLLFQQALLLPLHPQHQQVLHPQHHLIRQQGLQLLFLQVHLLPLLPQVLQALQQRLLLWHQAISLRRHLRQVHHLLLHPHQL